MGRPRVFRLQLRRDSLGRKCGWGARSVLVHRRAAALLPILAAVACGRLRAPEAFDRSARVFMHALHHEPLDSSVALLYLAGDSATIRLQLARVRDSMSGFLIDSAELVGWNVVTMGETRATLTYEAGARPLPRWALISVHLVRAGADSRVTGIYWEPTPARLADINAFSLGGRTVAHYAYLFLAGVSVLACVAGAIFAAVQRMGIRWVLFCLVGVGKASINWTTGHQAYNPFSFQILAASYFRPGLYAPWFVAWSLPLGAILAFLRWRERRAAHSSDEPGVAA